MSTTKKSSTINLSDATKKRLWNKALKEFPKERMLQEMFYLKLARQYIEDFEKKEETESNENTLLIKITEETINSLPAGINRSLLKILINNPYDEIELKRVLTKFHFSDEEIDVILAYTEKTI